MLIVQEEISSRGLIEPDCQIRLKNSTCDLTVGRIFPMGEDIDQWTSGLNQFVLQPSHMMTVLSTQKLNLPNNVTGIATLVTSLTQKGILCLNTGIVDPGYKGHLSATLVNFSNVPRTIVLNERLFRVLFIEHKELDELEYEPFDNPKKTYEATIRSKARQEFSETFLNVKGIVGLARENAWQVVITQMIQNWVPPLALLVALVGAIFGALAYFGGE